jgi:hypothetical protein
MPVRPSVTLAFLILAGPSACSGGATPACRVDDDCGRGRLCDQTGPTPQCTCTAVTCDADEYCDADARTCRPRCQRDDECAPGFCDTSTGRCAAEAAACATRTDCGAEDQVCEQATGRCRTRCDLLPCDGADQVCHARDLQCVARCTPADCADGQVCAPDGFCRGRCDVPAGGTRCAAAETCNAASGLCEAACARDPDCGEALRCDPDTRRCVECHDALRHCGYGVWCERPALRCVNIEDDCGDPARVRPATEPWNRAAGRGPLGWTTSVASASDVDGCPLLVRVAAQYLDPQGDFPTAAADLTRAVRILTRDGTADIPFGAARLVAESDGFQGSIEFSLCFEPTPEDPVVGDTLEYWLRDGAGNFGNTACGAVPPPGP